ncbi:MAG: uridylate kinase [Clostridiales bacterium]|nr:uridylate kinase [Clostridiales bacterium]
MEYQFDLVGKIGSMALIRKEDRDIDFNIFSRLGSELKPGMIWVTSGATEIGRLDYIKRTGCELCGDPDQDKADYAAQGQAVLMQTYRQFIPPEYGIRQILVEHTHFNDPEKSEHIRQLLIRAARQKTIPIINYNDPVSDEENRKMELAARREKGGEVHECVDNDETAAVIADLVKAKTLVLLTSTEGIYRESGNPDTLVREVYGASYEEVEKKVRDLQQSCIGASRAGAGGARAKLEYALGCVRGGTTVIIGHARHHLSDLLDGRVPCTRIGVRK